MERNLRKTLVGIVTSDKMDKTVVVSIKDRVKHPLYSKIVNKTVKIKAPINTDSGISLFIMITLGVAVITVDGTVSIATATVSILEADDTTGTGIKLGSNIMGKPSNIGISLIASSANISAISFGIFKKQNSVISVVS